jgi:hypothetical protein
LGHLYIFQGALGYIGPCKFSYKYIENNSTGTI